jgi:hypothetical protein
MGPRCSPPLRSLRHLMPLARCAPCNCILESSSLCCPGLANSPTGCLSPQLLVLAIMMYALLLYSCPLLWMDLLFIRASGGLVLRELALCPPCKIPWIGLKTQLLDAVSSMFQPCYAVPIYFAYQPHLSVHFKNPFQALLNSASLLWEVAFFQETRESVTFA